MAVLFTLGLLLYFLVAFRARLTGGAELAKLLWALYFALGVCATIIAATDVLQPAFPPNYPAALYLLLCVLVAITGFTSFRAKAVTTVLRRVRGQTLIEAALIAGQFYAIVFFVPFAAMSLTGDAKENRLDLPNKMELLGSFGLFNTVAGAASQLFAASLVMAFIRLCQPAEAGRNVGRAILLAFASLSYVVYILAYVGRDGVVYWLMTAGALFVVFRPHMQARQRSLLLAFGAAAGALMLLPFIAITLARFADWDHGAGWSILEYFGQQINTFSDYSSIERPMTLGVANFPMFVGAACSVVGIDCENWEYLKDIIFDQYLAQGKEPWLFGTFVSDFVGDFGQLGALVAISLFAVLCRLACGRADGRRPMTLSRLLLIVFLFLVPYWGVFYFRFSIINGFIVVNLAFVLFVWLLERGRTIERQRAVASFPLDTRNSGGAATLVGLHQPAGEL